MTKDLEKITMKIYELVKDLNKKVDYLIESRREDFYERRRYVEGK